MNNTLLIVLNEFWKHTLSQRVKHRSTIVRFNVSYDAKIIFKSHYDVKMLRFYCKVVMDVNYMLVYNALFHSQT